VKIILKSTHFNIELGPEELSDSSLAQLLEAVCGGWPVNNDTIGVILRDYRASAVNRSAAEDDLGESKPNGENKKR